MKCRSKSQDSQVASAKCTNDSHRICQDCRLEGDHRIVTFANGEARCRVVWIADVLPPEIAPSIEAMMDQGVIAMKSTLAR